MTTTIVLADDHQVVRQGLRALLEAEPGFAVVGEAADGNQVVDLVERTAPDVLVLDLTMPGLGGLEVTREVTRRFPGTRVVVLSMHSSGPYVLRALTHGAAAYVLKASSAADLLQAIREVRAGRRYLSPPLTEHAVEAHASRAKNAAAGFRPDDPPHDSPRNSREPLDDLPERPSRGGG